jgi:hypothetical protein
MPAECAEPMSEQRDMLPAMREYVAALEVPININAATADNGMREAGFLPRCPLAGCW